MKLSVTSHSALISLQKTVNAALEALWLETGSEIDGQLRLSIKNDDYKLSVTIPLKAGSQEAMDFNLGTGEQEEPR